jgi:hypothetical protein
MSQGWVVEVVGVVPQDLPVWEPYRFQVFKLKTTWRLGVTSPFFIMSPFSTALHQLSRLWGPLARKVKTVSDTSSSPGPLPSPQKILEEPQYAADYFNADNQVQDHSFSSSFSFSDPSSSFGLPWLMPVTRPHHGLTPVPVETEEIPSTVSYEEILVTGQNRIAAYEEWCRVTNVSII